MHLASIPFVPDRRRATSFLLAVAAHVLVVLLLLRLAPSPVQPPVEERPPATFSIAPAAEDSPKPTAKPRVAPKASAKAAAAAAPAPSTVAPIPKVAPPPPPLIGGMELFEAADIGKMKGKDGDSDGEATGKGDSVAAYGPGEGSGGQRLYNAEWYREPSRAELAGYLAGGAPPGSWALIACRTIEDFHVDNCRSLGEAPVGSGLARAMRLAAWQFRIRPPRVGGKAMVGAWVRIRFDFDREGGRNGATN